MKKALILLTLLVLAGCGDDKVYNTTVIEECNHQTTIDSLEFLLCQAQQQVGAQSRALVCYQLWFEDYECDDDKSDCEPAPYCPVAPVNVNHCEDKE